MTFRIFFPSLYNNLACKFVTNYTENMKSQSSKTLKQIKLLAGIYFIGLTIINLLLTWINVGINYFDFAIFVLAVFPFILNKRRIFLLFGILSSLASLYLTFACISLSMKVGNNTSDTEFFMGFLLCFMSLTFSLALVYVGLHYAERHRFHFI